MSDASTVWKELCGRLGVQPRQFATLLAVMVVAVGGLGIKMAAGGPRKAAAATARAQTPRSSQAVVSAKQESPAASVRKDLKAPSRKVIEMAFDRDPARDPFRPWGLPEPSEPVVQNANPRPASSEPGYLPGVMLKAVVSGEIAVFGDQTVRVGDPVALPDGTFAKVSAIRARTVTVEWNGRILDVTFGSAPQPKNPAPGGFR